MLLELVQSGIDIAQSLKLLCHSLNYARLGLKQDNSSVINLSNCLGPLSVCFLEGQRIALLVRHYKLLVTRAVRE